MGLSFTFRPFGESDAFITTMHLAPLAVVTRNGATVWPGFRLKFVTKNKHRKNGESLKWQELARAMLHSFL